MCHCYFLTLVGLVYDVCFCFNRDNFAPKQNNQEALRKAHNALHIQREDVYREREAEKGEMGIIPYRVFPLINSHITGRLCGVAEALWGNPLRLMPCQCGHQGSLNPE